MSIVDRWRIVEMDLWERETLDLVGPAFDELPPQQTGSLGFVAVEGSVDWRPVRRDGRPGAEFTWDGFDDDPASGRGWAVLRDGSLRGHVDLHLGDDSGSRRCARATSWGGDERWCTSERRGGPPATSPPAGFPTRVW